MDGGYANNLPVDVMSEGAAVRPQTIIAVDVEDRNLSSLQAMHAYRDGGISGFRLLLNALNPFCTQRVPPFHEVCARLSLCRYFVSLFSHPDHVSTAVACRLQVLMWLQGLSHNQHLRSIKRSMLDVYLRPPVQQFGLIDYTHMPEIVRLGYEYAQKNAWICAHAQQSAAAEAHVSAVLSSRASLGGSGGGSTNSNSASAAGGQLGLQRVASMRAFPSLQQALGSALPSFAAGNSSDDSVGGGGSAFSTPLGRRSASVSRLALINKNQGVSSPAGSARTSASNLATTAST